MSHSVKRAKSKFEQFRMAVPADLVVVVGKREWTHSLETTNRDVADAKRGEYIRLYKSEIVRLRGNAAQQANNRAAALVDAAFDRLARLRGSMDAAVAQQLTVLASFVFDSWAPREM